MFIVINVIENWSSGVHYQGFGAWNWAANQVDTGAILANGRGGCETTFCTEQREFFDKNIVAFCFQTDLKQ